MPVPTGGGGTTYGGEIVVGFFTRYNGSGWVLRGTRTHANYSGVNTIRSYTYQVTVDGMGQGAEFSIQILQQADFGGTATLNKVAYKVGTVPEAPATPGGILVPFIALGGA